MTLYKLNTEPSILIEDDCSKNIIPLIVNMAQTTKSSKLNVVCYEQPAVLWKRVFNGMPIQCFDKFPANYNLQSENVPSVFFIDSMNQMALDIGWHKCICYLKRLQNDPNISKIILILHKDCLSQTSKMKIHLHHLINAIVSFDQTDSNRVNIQIKKGGKIVKSEEILSYDIVNGVLKLYPVPKISNKTEETEKTLPSNLSTFKIETDQIQQLEKNKLKLPYMSKINEGKGKVYYEPDAVDDWDEEDPDDDLEI